MAELVDNTVASIKNGPVGKTAKAEADKTKADFADLANARTTPETPAATGQPLTHYHSMFYRLLSWKNPRATAISFVSLVAFIFAARYLHVLRYIFKGLYITLFFTASAEVAGKLAFGHGFTSQLRPRKYFVIPKASLERFLDDFEQLINFFVIETQRVVFAENIYVTIAAFVSTFISYFLIKWLPLWGLSLIFTTLIYMGPLVYLQNKELIDAQLDKGRELASAQANQIRDLAAQHTGRAGSAIRGYTNEYTHKAQEYYNNARGRTTSPEPVNGVENKIKKEDFPKAPSEEPVVESVEPHEPVAQAL